MQRICFVLLMLSVLSMGFVAPSRSAPLSNANEALETAVDHGDLKAAVTALRHGADANYHNVLLAACNSSQYEWPTCDGAMVKLLIDHGANVNVTDGGDTALMLLAGVPPDDKWFMATYRLLIAHGIDVYKRNGSGQTAFIVAAMDGNDTLIRLLGGYKFAVDDRDASGMTALEYACYIQADEENSGPDVAIAKYLIQRGANVNVQNKTGRTPLMWLAKTVDEHEADAVALAKFLVRHGARVDMKNDQGKTAFQIAYANGLRKLARYLRSVERGSKG